MKNTYILLFSGLFLLSTSACRTASVTADDDSAYGGAGYSDSEDNDGAHQMTPPAEPEPEIQPDTNDASMDYDYSDGEGAEETSIIEPEIPEPIDDEPEAAEPDQDQEPAQPAQDAEDD
jgi:hypothetical protein